MLTFDTISKEPEIMRMVILSATDATLKHNPHLTREDITEAHVRCVGDNVEVALICGDRVHLNQISLAAINANVMPIMLHHG